MTLPQESKSVSNLALVALEMKLDMALSIHYQHPRSRNLLERARHCKKREDHLLYKMLQSCAPQLREVKRPLWLDHPGLDLTILKIEKEIENDLREPYCPAFHRIMREAFPKKGLTENGMVQLAEVIQKVINVSKLAPEFPINREIDIALDKWFNLLEF